MNLVFYHLLLPHFQLLLDVRDNIQLLKLYSLPICFYINYRKIQRLSRHLPPTIIHNRQFAIFTYNIRHIQG